VRRYVRAAGCLARGRADRKDAPGPEGLDDLDGAFAAAWWDGEKRRLTLIRDPFGVRSLYYTEHRGVFYFASELKQLSRCRASLRSSITRRSTSI
jgi:asparagine synthetase B (glutamine-hydrolysing)